VPHEAPHVQILQNSYRCRMPSRYLIFSATDTPWPPSHCQRKVSAWIVSQHVYTCVCARVYVRRRLCMHGTRCDAQTNSLGPVCVWVCTGERVCACDNATTTIPVSVIARDEGWYGCACYKHLQPTLLICTQRRKGVLCDVILHRDQQSLQQKHS